VDDHPWRIWLVRARIVRVGGQVDVDRLKHAENIAEEAAALNTLE